MAIQRFRFMQDNDSHWYLIPEDQQQHFIEWLSLDDFTDRARETLNLFYNQFKFEDRRISGPVEDFTFTEPKED